MSPRGQVALRKSEAPLLLVTCRCGFDEPDYAILTEAVQIAIGKDQRSLAHASIAQRDLARIKTDGSQNRARESVKVIASHNEAPVMIAHVLREPDFLGLVVCLDLNYPTTGAVVGRDEDAIRTRDRRRHIRDLIRRFSILPQQPAILRIESNGAFRREEDYLRRTV